MVLAVGLAGCSGEADLTIVNMTSRYANGDVEGRKFGLVSGGSTTKTLEVGGFLKSSSDVKINVRVHATTDGCSPVVDRWTKTMKLQKDYSYTYEFFHCAPSGPYKLRLLKLESNSGLLRP